MSETTFESVTGRIGRLDRDGLQGRLDTEGFAVTEPVLTAGESVDLADLFDSDRFRSTIEMARHRFGDGRYRYFAHPLPEPIAAARVAFYERLAPIANRWADLLPGGNPTFPLTHEELLERCREAGQERPTPLMLRYARAEPRARPASPAGRVRGLPGPGAAEPGRERLPPRGPASRRLDRHRRHPHGAGRHLPRREVTGSHEIATRPV